MRFFNTAGPIKPEIHYNLPPLERFDLTHFLTLIDQMKYFVLHAPRQTGKTSSMLALTDYLNRQGKYRCLYINVEAAQAARENVDKGIRTILSEMASRARTYLKDSFLQENWLKIFETSGGEGTLNEAVTRWTENNTKPLILLMDEIDSLVGDTLISVLRQLRAGYDKRPAQFPQSIVLCGIRDVRDYRIHSDKEKSQITGGSAFNIKAESLRLGNFTEEETGLLYQCHTEETGQKFADGVLGTVREYTQGQPWLVNALGYEVCFRMKENADRLKVITPEMIREAVEAIILRRETHIDQLVDKLKEERVRRVISPVLEGTGIENIRQDDIQYLLDLGLIRKTPSGLAISNAIYMEVIPRELTVITQYNLEPMYQPNLFICPDGSLDTDKLMTAFQDFFRKNSESWIERFDYKEAGPQLLLQAFLQRIVNSGGRIEREYGLGRRRTDLLILWNYGEKTQQIVMELRIRYETTEKTIKEGLEQTYQYMDKCGATQGHLIIFDRRKSVSWSKKIFRKVRQYQGQEIVVWGM